jgi:hypothetical protein
MRPLLWNSTEIDPWTGQPYTWDSPNPNVTWDGIREPGDEGYIPPPTPSPVQPPTKHRKMKHQAYYPTSVPEQILWLTNFFLKLLIHGAALGLSAPQIAAAVADCRWLIYLLGSYRPAERAAAKANTDFMREAQTGTGEAVLVLPDFDPPPLPPADAAAGLPAVVPQKPGALTRIFSLVQVIKESASESVATDLGIVGAEAPPPPPAGEMQPVIKVKRVGAHNVVEWGWNGLRDHVDMLQIQVDRGQGWVDLAYDSTPDYNDTHPHPAALTTWKYRAIWRADDAQIGIWSAEVSIVVGG